MKEKVIPIEDWLQSFQEAANEVADRALRFDGTGSPAPAAGQSPGVYIALTGERDSIHLGLNSTPEGCRTLVRGFLGMRFDQDLEGHEVVDGISEVMNIMAGKVKSKMSGKDGELRLGLPMFLPNPAAVGGGAETASKRVKLGPVDCDLVVYRHRRAA